MAWWRRGDGDGDPAAGQADAIRGAIAELMARRETAASAAGAALLNQAEVRHALLEQHRQLTRARTELASAIALAERVADDVARDDGALAADPFRQNVEGLRFQADVIDSAVTQVDDLGEVSDAHVEAARSTLVRSRALFDEALHEQLRLLIALERLERARLVLQARAAAAGRDD